MSGTGSVVIPGTRREASPIHVLAQDRPNIVTIDGPAGTGKSSVARALAARLRVRFLDTGAMYRAAAAVALDRGIDLNDHGAVVALVRDADIRFDWDSDPPAVMAFGKRMDHRIRDPDVTAVVSPVAGIAGLRGLMVEAQREIARERSPLVTEGRDQGSVVFPDARVKFFLDASASVRAARRAAQLGELGLEADAGVVLEEIIRRDRSDSTRAAGPLVCPPDAVRLDTSNMTVDEVVSALERHVRGHGDWG